MSATATAVTDNLQTSSTREAKTVRVLRSLAELETVRSAWNDWCDDPNADMELYLAWARRHAEFVRPHVVVIFRDDQPECILVGRLENRRLQIKLGYAKLLRPKVRQLFFVRFGFLGNTSAENMELLVRSFKASLDNGEADLAEISRPRPMPQLDSAIASQFRTIRRDHFAAENEHRWLELPGTFDEFIDSLSRKDRHEFRRHEKKLKEQFPAAHIQCYRSEHELDSLTHAMEQISGKTYQRALGTGFVADDETLESLRITARQGGLRGCVLYMNDEPGAFFLARAYKHRLHGNYMGFDPKFSKYSPGLKVLMHAVEDCYDPEYPVRELDLGWGDRRYKRMICNRSCKDGVAHIYAPTAKAISLNFLCSAVRGLDVAARWAVENSRFLQRLKKAWLDRRALRSGESTDEEP